MSEISPLSEYARLEALDPLNGTDFSELPLRDVDWGAVHRLEVVAPCHVIIPDADAAVQSKRMRNWEGKHTPEDSDRPSLFRSYLFVYAEGDDVIDGQDDYQRGTARYIWREPIIQFMVAVRAETAAIYRAEDLSHRVLHRVWARHHHIYAQIPQEARVKWMDENSVKVRPAPLGAPEDAVH